jgi:hypothetical protein
LVYDTHQKLENLGGPKYLSKLKVLIWFSAHNLLIFNSNQNHLSQYRVFLTNLSGFLIGSTKEIIKILVKRADYKFVPHSLARKIFSIFE